MDGPLEARLRIKGIWDSWAAIVEARASMAP
jgi:hypothetical protein